MHVKSEHLASNRLKLFPSKTIVVRIETIHPLKHCLEYVTLQKPASDRLYIKSATNSDMINKDLQFLPEI